MYASGMQVEFTLINYIGFNLNSWAFFDVRCRFKTRKQLKQGALRNKYQETPLKKGVVLDFYTVVLLLPQ